MDLQALDNGLQEMVLKRNELSVMDYGHEKYDDLEEELHDLEDDFSKSFGAYLEEAFYDVHDEFCPDSDVLMPIAYLGKKYKVEDGKFDVDHTQGVYVEMDDYPEQETKLVLIPNPTRIVLQINKEERNVVWVAGK
jgi:hypothetical protein